MVVAQEAEQRGTRLRDVRRGYRAGPRREVLRDLSGRAAANSDMLMLTARAKAWSGRTATSLAISHRRSTSSLSSDVKPHPAAAAARPCVPDTTGSSAHSALHACKTVMAVVGAPARRRFAGPASMAAGSACTQSLRFPRREAATTGMRVIGGASEGAGRHAAAAGSVTAPALQLDVGAAKRTSDVRGGAAARNGAGGLKRPAGPP
jgi:hypothetical protein